MGLLQVANSWHWSQGGKMHDGYVKEFGTNLLDSIAVDLIVFVVGE